MLYWTLSLACHMGPTTCGLQYMYHNLIISIPTDLVGICHALITCSSGACKTHTIPSFMQFLGSWHMSQALIICSSRACRAHAMAPVHAGLELTGRCHAIIKCNFQAGDTHAMPSAINSYWFTFIYITSYYFIFYCSLSLIDPVSPGPWCLQDMYHIFIACSPGAWLAYVMSSLHAILELAIYMPCPHYMQFLSLGHICHALIVCSFEACRAHAMPSLHAVLEYILGIWHAIIKCNFGACGTYIMPPVIALYCFMLLCITLYYFVFVCTLRIIDPMGLAPCSL